MSADQPQQPQCYKPEFNLDLAGSGYPASRQGFPASADTMESTPLTSRKRTLSMDDLPQKRMRTGPLPQEQAYPQHPQMYQQQPMQKAFNEFASQQVGPNVYYPQQQQQQPQQQCLDNNANQWPVWQQPYQGQLQGSPPFEYRQQQQCVQPPMQPQIQAQFIVHNMPPAFNQQQCDVTPPPHHQQHPAQLDCPQRNSPPHWEERPSSACSVRSAGSACSRRSSAGSDYQPIRAADMTIIEPKSPEGPKRVKTTLWRPGLESDLPSDSEGRDQDSNDDKSPKEKSPRERAPKKRKTCKNNNTLMGGPMCPTPASLALQKMAHTTFHPMQQPMMPTGPMMPDFPLPEDSFMHQLGSSEVYNPPSLVHISPQSDSHSSPPNQQYLIKQESPSPIHNAEHLHNNHYGHTQLHMNVMATPEVCGSQAYYPQQPYAPYMSNSGYEQLQQHHLSHMNHQMAPHSGLQMPHVPPHNQVGPQIM